MPEMLGTVLEQLMQQIRNEDDLIHRWAATLVTTQGGLLAGAGILWNASGLGIHSKGLGTVLVAMLAVPIAWACCTAIRSECRWQGEYILYLQALPGNDWLYKSFKVPVDKDGHAVAGGAIVTAVGLVEIAMYVLWGLLVVGAVVKVAYWSPYF